MYVCIYINYIKNTIFFHIPHLWLSGDFLFSPRGVGLWKKRCSNLVSFEEQGGQTMEKNETGCQAAPEAPILCVNNCGFFGTPATMNMCSKCHKDMILKQEQAKLAASSIESIVNGGGNSSNFNKESCVAVVPSSAEPEVVDVSTQPSSASKAEAAAKSSEKPKEGPSRCTTCRKRVGLTGFNCRCGHIFCSVHRYSDKHDCPFDYRATAKDAIAKANPVVKAEKLEKI